MVGRCGPFPRPFFMVVHFSGFGGPGTGQFAIPFGQYTLPQAESLLFREILQVLGEFRASIGLDHPSFLAYRRPKNLKSDRRSNKETNNNRSQSGRTDCRR